MSHTNEAEAETNDPEAVLDAEVIEAETLNYATPGVDASQEIWRDKKLLVTRHSTSLPHRCVRCNAPADGSYRPRTFYWHHPLYFLLLPAGIVLYAIIALVVRQKAIVDVGLCREHQKQQSRRILLAWLVGLLGLPAMIAGPMLDFYLHAKSFTVIGLIGGVALILIGAFLGVTVSALKPRRMNHRLAWFAGCSPEFLGQFPPLS